MTAPLTGVLVVALESAVSAPFATRQLADLGAEVLKVERTGEGDFARHYDTSMGGTSAFFVWANRAKQSIELNLKDPADKVIFDELVAGTDVFIQNLSPAAAGRLGVQADQLRENRPELIACDISGYGTGGPRTDDKAYDLAIQAEGGAIALTGTPEQPCKVGFSIADIASGMYAFSSILAALYRREVTGEGASIEVSMLESLAEWTAAPTYNSVGNDRSVSRSGHRHSMIAPYGMYELDDGSTVLIGVQANREFVAFAKGVLLKPSLPIDPRFAENADRVANIDALEEIIRETFAATPAAEILSRLAEHRVTHSRVRDPLSLWKHEQLRARDRFMTLMTPTGSTQSYKPPFNISGLPLPEATVPALGADATGLADRLRRRGSTDDVHREL